MCENGVGQQMAQLHDSYMMMVMMMMMTTMMMTMMMMTMMMMMMMSYLPTYLLQTPNILDYMPSCESVYLLVKEFSAFVKAAIT
jgi:hypothetical protein